MSKVLDKSASKNSVKSRKTTFLIRFLRFFTCFRAFLAKTPQESSYAIFRNAAQNEFQRSLINRQVKILLNAQICRAAQDLNQRSLIKRQGRKTGCGYIARFYQNRRVPPVGIFIVKCHMYVPKSCNSGHFMSNKVHFSTTTPSPLVCIHASSCAPCFLGYQVHASSCAPCFLGYQVHASSCASMHPVVHPCIQLCIHASSCIYRKSSQILHASSCASMHSVVYPYIQLCIHASSCASMHPVVHIVCIHSNSI